MKNYSKISFSFFFSFLVIGWFLWYVVWWSYSYGQFLDSNTKEALFDTMYKDPSLLGLIDTNSSRVSLEDLSRAFDNLEQQTKNVQSTKWLIDVNFSQVQKKLEAMIQESNALTFSLQKSLDEITSYQQRIAIAKQRLGLLQKDYDLHKTYLVSYAHLLYKIQNEIYNDDDVISQIKLLVKSDTISETMTQDEFMKIITDKIQFLLYDLQMQKQSYEASVAQMNFLYLEHQEKVANFEKELAWVELQRKELVTIFGMLQQGREEAKDEINRLSKEKYNLWQEMKELEQLNHQTKLIQSNVSDMISKSDREVWGKYFTRPILPLQKILYFFQDQAWKEQEQSDHNGLRLSVIQGKEVMSPASAIVYKVQDTWEKTALRWVVLVHKNWFMSIMMPLSKILVKEGEFVERWQIIWLSWGKPWTRGAGSLQQPQLYRELYKDGKLVDPLQYLETSIFADKTFLPERYRPKYDDDLMQRTIRVEEAETLVGKTPSQRVSFFLAQHAPEPYNDVRVWMEWSKATGIDPYFWICVGWAETSFRNFKSQNNIWNVGNDDSGNTKEFTTVQEGIEALFNVLNNKYLGNYYTIDQLSRYGNSDGFIYASSPFNRQNNITKCLTSIYWYYVPEDYPFRRYR